MITTLGAARPTAFAVFRRRNFALLWLAEFISTMGGGLTSIAASILVFRLTGSALSVGLMLMATALPSLFVGLIAGVFVDRYDRRRIMIAADLLRAALVVSIPFMLPFGIVWLYILVALSSTVTQFFEPAQASVLPETAPDEELAAANAMMTISSVGSTTVGFAAAGLIASAYAIEWAFYLDALTFVLSALCIVLLRVTPLGAQEETNVASVVRNLRAGLGVVRDTPALCSLFLMFIPISILFGLDNSLQLPFATRALGATEFEYSLLEGVFSVGFVIGGFVLAGLADRLHQGQWITISLFGMALFTSAMVLSQSVPLALTFNVVAGAFNAPLYIGRQLLIQRNTTREVRGRVSSALIVTRDTMFVVGMALAALADVIDVRVLLLAGMGLLFVAGLVSLRLPGLGESGAEWRRILAMLRAAPSASGLGLGHAATLADIDALAMRLPALIGVGAVARRELATNTRVYNVPTGTPIVRQGETSNAAYFLLDGRTVAVRQAEDASERVLEVHNAGDFFGEIAALTSVPRTASVVAEQPTVVLQVPAPALRKLMTDPQINRLFLNKLTERMARMRMIDLPRFAGLDQEALRELRTPEPQTAADVQPAVATV